MSDENAKRYTVVFSYDTMADSPEEALELALSAVADRNGGYVEVFPEGSDVTVREAELGSFFPASEAPSV